VDGQTQILFLRAAATHIVRHPKIIIRAGEMATLSYDAIPDLRASAIASQVRVIYALILRDMRTRFGRSFLGYLVAIAFPLTHLLVLTASHVAIKRIAPVGTDHALFIATGILPYILCFYPARMIMLCIVQNHPLLAFPIVKPLDIMFARAALEVVIAFTVTIIYLLVLLTSDVEAVPLDAVEATAAILSTIFLGVGIGMLSAILYKLTRAWLAIQIGTMILLFASCGAFFVPTALSEEIRNILWYNPLLHSVEWLRLAYYEGYGEEMLSRQYLISVAVALFFISILGEKAIRGRIMMS
jgi:capsular polysaccharide transport system permease protein